MFMQYIVVSSHALFCGIICVAGLFTLQWSMCLYIYMRINHFTWCEVLVAELDIDQGSIVIGIDPRVTAIRHFKWKAACPFITFPIAAVSIHRGWTGCLAQWRHHCLCHRRGAYMLSNWRVSLLLLAYRYRCFLAPFTIFPRVNCFFE